MKTAFISTLSLANTTRSSIMDQSISLSRLQKEVSSGRKFDVGLDLGIGTGETISLRSEFARLNTIVDTNALVTSRLDVTEKAMINLRDSGQDLLSTLVASIGSETGREVTIADAKNNLQQLVATLNTSFSGTYVFSGINVSEPPVTDYYDPAGSASRTAVQTSLTSYLASVPTTVDAMTPAEMDDYLNNYLTTEFDNPGAWATNWSTASDQATVNRISTSETIETSISANIDPMRKIAMAFTMVADLGGANMSQETFDVVASKAASLLGEGVEEMNNAVGKIGNAQARVKKASLKLNMQTDLFNKRILDLENIDKTKASVVLSNAITQMEVTYAVTSRMQHMSLLNYL